MLGYLCAYYRHYYPIEFITSFLNNAANEDDIRNGINYAKKIGIKVTMPKWGISKSEYFFNRDNNIIAKGLTSIKYMGSGIAEKMYNLAHSKEYKYFVDILHDIRGIPIDRRKLDILIKLDFFVDFGNQRELLRITELFHEIFKDGEAKRVSRSKVDGTLLEPIITKYAECKTKAGTKAVNYTLLNTKEILHETEENILNLNMEDLDESVKVKNFIEATGYMGYISNKEEDRRKLYVMKIYPLVRKRDNKQFGYSFITKSIGSGIESRFTVFNRVYDVEPIKEGDIICCTSWERDGKYFRMTGYKKIF